MGWSSSGKDKTQSDIRGSQVLWVLWTQQRRFLLLMAILRMFCVHTQVSDRDRTPDPQRQNLSTTSMQKREKVWVNIPSSHGGRGAQSGVGWTGSTRMENNRWTQQELGWGNGVLEEWGTLREKRDGNLKNRAKLWGGGGGEGKEARFV